MGLFDKLLKPSPKMGQKLQLFESDNDIFNTFGDNPYKSAVVRQAVHSVASNVAKLKPAQIRRDNAKIINVNDTLARKLQFNPNKYMNTYDFLYKVTTQLLLKNNAFIFIKYDPLGNLEGFYPLKYDNVQLKHIDNEIYTKFTLNGKEGACLYSDLIHLRRHYYDNDYFGDSNSEALLPNLELINTTNQGILNAVKRSAKVRGLLKFATMVRREDKISEKQKFEADFFDVSNDGGVAVVDTKADFIELKADYKMIDDKQMKFIKEEIYAYYNTNEKIVNSSFTEEEWNAFYENTIEPIAIQLSLEFTNKLFTEREKGFGRELIFEANRLQYSSVNTKINLIRDLTPLGLFTINEGREVFNMAPVEGGDKRIQTLNVVDAEKANQYQGVDGGGQDGNKDS